MRVAASCCVYQHSGRRLVGKARPRATNHGPFCRTINIVRNPLHGCLWLKNSTMPLEPVPVVPLDRFCCRCLVISQTQRSYYEACSRPLSHKKLFHFILFWHSGWGEPLRDSSIFGGKDLAPVGWSPFICFTQAHAMFLPTSASVDGVATQYVRRK